MNFTFMFEYSYYYLKGRIFVDQICAKSKEEAIIRFFHLHGGRGYRIETIYVESLNGWVQIL